MEPETESNQLVFNQQLISEKEKATIFESLLDSLFENNLTGGDTDNGNRVSLKISEEKALILTSWFNNGQNDLEKYTAPESESELTLPEAIFGRYLESDHSKTLWEVFRLLENQCLTKYTYGPRWQQVLYVCQDGETVSVVTQTPVLSCSTCGTFRYLHLCCPHLLLLHLSVNVATKVPSMLPTTLLSAEDDVLLLLRRSAH